MRACAGSPTRAFSARGGVPTDVIAQAMNSLESCQQSLPHVIAIDHTERAGSVSDTTISAKGIDSEKISQTREAGAEPQKKQAGGKQKPHPQLEEGKNGIQAEF